MGNLLGGILLVTGTCIGGGMLALPVLTSMGGFFPSTVVYFLCWIFMACTGLLFLEVSHWMNKDANIVSMAERTLGPVGKAAAWIVYLFFFYCLTLAYMVGGGNLVTLVLPLPDWSGPFLFTLLFAPFVIAGARVVGKINGVLVVGLALSFFAFLFMGYTFVNVEQLQERNWSYALFALPIAFTSFGYQGVIPSLNHYMNYDVRKTRLAILIGSFIPLVTYIIWEAFILGIVPTEGPGGLIAAMESGSNAVDPLKNFIISSHVYIVGQFFAFFALTTSFLGVTLGLLDFLSDGLKIKDKKVLSFLVFIPPLIFATLYPHLFLKALDLSGGFGSSLLLGVLPIVMVWAGRYHLRLHSPYSLPGGKPTLISLLLFVTVVIYYTI